jgi:hypothetical protein
MRVRHPVHFAACAAGLLVAVFVVAQISPAAGPGGSQAGSVGLVAPAGGPAVSAAGDPANPMLPAAIGDRTEGDGGPPSGMQTGAVPGTLVTSPTGPSSQASAGAQAVPAITPVGGGETRPGSRNPSVALSTPAWQHGCPMFPSNNVWNRDISSLPVASNSAAMVNAIGRTSHLHPDFDAIGDGIPYNLVDRTTPAYTVRFDYADESDAGPYPIPANPSIEAGSDRHMLLLDKGGCRLYELYDVRKSGSTWYAGSGAIWNLRSNALRPDGWTSAEAAGLPILPGLVLYSEVQAGAIKHAIRFTASATCGYIYPARHLTAAPCSNLPPMGLRVRLKASVDISGFGPQARVVLTALKQYGLILADNGSPWYIGGEPNAAWNDSQLHLLQGLTGDDFEVVDTSALRNG